MDKTCGGAAYSGSPRSTFRLTVCVGLASTLTATALVGQPQIPRGGEPIPEPRQGETVTDRSRPDYDPRGVRVGSFLIFPRLAITAELDDNVFATRRNRVQDTIRIMSPSVTATSIFSRHALNFNASTDIARYTDEHSEDTDDWRVETDGRLDVSRVSNAFGGVGIRKLHEPRGSPDDEGGRRPTEYKIRSANVGYLHGFNRLEVRLRGNVDQYDFSDTPSSSGVIDNDDRDRDEFRAGVRFGYEISPNYEAFLSASYTRIDYDRPVNNDGVNRDSKGPEYLLGVGFDLTGVTSGEVLIGIERREFEDSQLEDSNNTSLRFAITWNVTRLTTIQAFADRRVEQTTVDGASENLQSVVSISADHELRRNVIVSLALTGIEDDFQGIPRTDRTGDLGLGVRWLINPNFFAGVRYSARHRNSDVADDDYVRNTVQLTIGGQF